MRKGLARSIILGLMVTTLGYAEMTEAAVFESGTHDISGEYNTSDSFAYAYGTSISLTASDDVKLIKTSTPQGGLVPVNGGAISVDMGGHNFDYEGNYALMVDGRGSVDVYQWHGNVTIENVKNVDVNIDAEVANVLNSYAYGGDTTFKIDASGTINMNSSSNYTGIALSSDSTHAVVIDIRSMGDTKIKIGGRNIYIDTNSDATCNVVSKKGNVNLISSNSSNIDISSGNVNLQGNKVLLNAKSNCVQNSAGNVDVIATNGAISMTAGESGIAISNGGKTNLHSDTTIAAGTSSVTATTNAAVTFDKALTATAAPAAVEASGGAKVTATNSSSTKQVAGTMTADGAGTSVDMNFATADSYFTGATTVSNSGAINLSFANGAPWNVTADSSLTSLENNSVVNMTYTGAGNYETVTTDTLSGAGSFTMNTDLQASKDNLDVTTNSDKLVINNTSSGTHTIDIDDASLLSGKQAEGYLLLVEDKTSGGATFVGGNIAKGGLFKYTPLILSVNPGDNSDVTDTYGNVPTSNTKNWYLAGYEKSGELLPVVAPLIGAGENRYAAYRFEQDNLLLRLGELRDNENSQGIWARVKTAEETVNDTTDSRFTMYQVGYDKKYKDDENGRKYFGVAFNHTKGDQDYSSTSHGESSSNAMTLYNTWLGKKGHYLDLVGKVGKINTDWDYSNARFPDSGDSKAWFYSLSGEYGRKIMNKDGFYTEPQAQLTYGHINGAGYTSDSGINVDQDSINSLIGRVGFTIGKHFNGDEDGKRTNVYAKLFYNHEFLGDSDVHMNDTYGDSYSHSGDFGGSWWTAGVGVTAQLDKKTNAYFDVQKTFGGDIQQKWQFNVGLRWNWGGAKKAKVVETVVEPAPVAPVKETYLDSVHFDFDVDTPITGEMYKIDHFAEVAKENPDKKYAVVGNTDAIGTDEYNMDLSKRRADNVKTEAAKRGVPTAQMQENYLGKAHPVEDNSTDKGRAANRRVEIYEHETVK